MKKKLSLFFCFCFYAWGGGAGVFCFCFYAGGGGGGVAGGTRAKVIFFTKNPNLKIYFY